MGRCLVVVYAPKRPKALSLIPRTAKRQLNLKTTKTQQKNESKLNILLWKDFQDPLLHEKANVRKHIMTKYTSVSTHTLFM